MHQSLRVNWIAAQGRHQPWIGLPNRDAPCSLFITGHIEVECLVPPVDGGCRNVAPTPANVQV